MKPLVIYHADCTDGFGAAGFETDIGALIGWLE